MKGNFSNLQLYLKKKKTIYNCHTFHLYLERTLIVPNSVRNYFWAKRPPKLNYKH